jgi:hypothetical protein
MNATSAVEIRCDLKPYDDFPEWPPIAHEYLLCELQHRHQATVVNSPFFVDGLGLDDVISCEPDGRELVYRDLVRDSGNSTIQVVYLEISLSEARALVEALGCSSESALQFHLLSVVVPASVSYASVYNELAHHADDIGSLMFREAKVSRVHLPERPPLAG